jgi:hypothetical protein
MCKQLLIAACLLAATLPAAARDDYKVVKCDADGAVEISRAYRFVAENKDEIFDAMTYLTTKQRDEMKEKWGRVTIECIDDKNTCVKKSGKGGHAHGGIGNRVNVCYYNHVSRGLSRCDLVNTLVHEEAHANGMPSMKGHDDATPAVVANDLVYRMGNDAQRYCEAQPQAARFDIALKGRAGLALSDVCSKDDQCSSGKCERNQCVCNDNNDCPGAQKCKKPLGGINQCRP